MTISLDNISRSFKIIWPFFYHTFWAWALWGLVTLTSDLLTSKRHHEFGMPWGNNAPNFFGLQFLMDPSRLFKQPALITLILFCILYFIFMYSGKIKMPACLLLSYNCKSWCHTQMDSDILTFWPWPLTFNGVPG